MNIIFAAGGTGGHINPALSVAGELKRRNPETGIMFIGTADKLEARLVPQAGYEFGTIEISGFKRYFNLQGIKENLLTVKRLMRVTGQVEKIFDRFKPDIVMGFGGYVSGPVVRYAAKKGIPTAIHEQNAYPGVANKALSNRVDSVMLTAVQAQKLLKCKNPPVLTGLPVRPEFLSTNKDFSRAELGIEDDKILIVSSGGSLGARAVNEAVLELILKMHDDSRFVFIHGTGQNGLWFKDRMREAGVEPDSLKNVRITEYIDNMAQTMSAADIVISRAGASSLTEIEALGAASILIPSPNVTENHQYHNAMALVNESAAVLIEESELNADILAGQVRRLADNAVLRRSLGENAKKLSKPHAEKTICDILEKLAEK